MKIKGNNIMSKPYFKTLLKNENINLYEDTREKLPAGRKGRFYLWDKYCGMNLAMGAITKEDAFIEAMDYYRTQLIQYKTQYNELNNKVNSFVSQFIEDED